MPLPLFTQPGMQEGKTAYILGLGQSGIAAAEELAKWGWPVAVWDDNLQALQESPSRFPVWNPNDIAWGKVAFMLKSPGISMENPAVEMARAAGIPVVGDLDLLWQRELGSGAHFVAITGTNGKSTTTALIGHVLKAAGYNVAVGGNIGTPALALPELEANEKGAPFYVLECSSYQLEMLQQMQPDAAVFLNITPDHLERHKTMENYMAVKLELLHQVKAGGNRVMGVDQPAMATAARGVQATTVSVAGHPASVEVQGGMVYQNGQPLFNGETPELRGPHNAQNVACAWAAVSGWVSPAVFHAALQSFKGLPHRMETVARRGKVLFVNDSKATNGDSAVPALETFPAIYWICGGKAKTDGLGPTVNHLQNVRAVFTMGSSGETFATELEQRGLPVFRCGVMEKAVREAYASAKQEDLPEACVLLSPATASQDQYKNFEERGDDFASCVRGLV